MKPGNVPAAWKKAFIPPDPAGSPAIAGGGHARAQGYEAPMPIIATIMDSATAQPIQKMSFGRMPRVGAAFVLASGAQVTAQRVEVGKPAPGKVVTPVSVWVAPQPDSRQP